MGAGEGPAHIDPPDRCPIEIGPTQSWAFPTIRGGYVSIVGSEWADGGDGHRRG